MDINCISPFIRLAMYSEISYPFVINERVILDFEIIYVDGGECIITAEGTRYVCREGSAVFIPPGVKHKFESVNGRNFIQPHIHFDMVYDRFSFRRYICFNPPELLDAASLEMIPEIPHELRNIPFVFIPENKAGFKRLVYKTIDFFGDKDTRSSLACKSCVTMLLYMIFSRFDICAKPAVSVPEEITAVKNYIENNFMNILSLDAIAAYFHLNKFTMLRKYKRCCGMGIMEYYNSLRLDFSKNLLKNSDMPISEISERLNYESAYSFSRFFKIHTGISPLKYRGNKNGQG